MNAYEHLDKADDIRNRDTWIGDREGDADYHVKAAIAKALLDLIEILHGWNRNGLPIEDIRK